jgi:hypothetical protein
MIMTIQTFGDYARWNHHIHAMVADGLFTPDDTHRPGAISSPFSTAKMTYDEQTGTVIYRSKMTYGRNRKNFELFSAVEFIAAITQHIPEKTFSLYARKRKQVGQGR